MTTIASTRLRALYARNPSQNRTEVRGIAIATYTQWPLFWKCASIQLTACGYRPSTRVQYRQILRAFVCFVNKPPNQVQYSDIRAYLRHISKDHVTWNWTAMNISVLRTLFDKLSGLNALTCEMGPHRSKPLLEYLNRSDIARLLAAAGNLRDQLAIALLYGCGLKTNELQRITWNDIDPEAGTLLLTSRYSGQSRVIRLPINILSVLRHGKNQCLANQQVISGARLNQPISTRSIQRIITIAARKLDLAIPVTPMTLRHSFAVHYLEDGGNIRELQTILDHQTLEATMRYEEVTPAIATPPTQIQIDPVWETLAVPPFHLTEFQTGFIQLLKTRIKDRFLALRAFWRTS